MTRAAELRAEAARLRESMRETADPTVAAELLALIEELERLARAGDNGDATPVARHDNPYEALAP